MRNREVWAFVLGVGLSSWRSSGPSRAFESSRLISSIRTASGSASLVVFGGAGVAAIAGLVMMYTRRERAA